MQELIQIDWFGDVTIGVQVVAFDDIFFRLGCGQNDDGNPLEIIIYF